jgi:hypothetical protein
MSDPKDLIDLGLITAVSGMFPLGKIEDDKSASAAIRVQMEGLDGKIYFASLNLEAAQNMVLGLSTWQPIRDLL